MAISSISTLYLAGAPSLIAPPQLLRAHRPSSLQLRRCSLAIAATAAEDSPKSPPPRSRRGRVPPPIEEKIQKFPSFASLLETFDKPILVEFYTTWCVPCQLLRPNLLKAARLTINHVQFVRFDIDKNRGLAAKFGIKAVPTYILFKNGEQIDRFEGAKTIEYYVNRLRTALKRKAAAQTVDVRPVQKASEVKANAQSHSVTPRFPSLIWRRKGSRVKGMEAESFESEGELFFFDFDADSQPSPRTESTEWGN